MNDEIELTDEQLKLATARTLPAESTLDSETAALRDTFLLLGTSLEARAARFDEHKLLARLKSTCLEQPAVGLPVSTARSNRPAWQILLAGALAAVALMAIVGFLASRRANEGQIAMAPTKGKSQTGVRLVPPVRSSLEQGPAWSSDPLDVEIALAQVQIEGLQTRSPGLDGSLWKMNERLEALSQELLGESL